MKRAVWDLDPIPLPSASLLRADDPTFEACPELEVWARSHFVVDPEDPLWHVQHSHLEEATIGFLWASVGCKRDGGPIAGTAGLGPPSGGDAWTKGQRGQQLRGYFGGIPDFVITIDANYFFEAPNPARCALIAHELCHCAIKEDKDGQPMFDKETSLPIWGILRHDVEEFVSVVERFGVFASAGKMAAMATAIRNGPTVAMAAIEGICGTCGRKAA